MSGTHYYCGVCALSCTAHANDLLPEWDETTIQSHNPNFNTYLDALT
jgi:hypothetical protein